MSNPSSFKLLNIVLLESNFKRKEQLDSSPDLPQAINIDISTQKDGLNLFVILNLDFIAGNEAEPIVSAKIKMVGGFEISDGENTLNPDYFANVNAPAIIFPFIREHLASVSLKAGLNPILLPPINFVKLADDKKALKQSSSLEN